MTRKGFVIAAIALFAACSGAIAQEDDIYSPKLRIAWEEFKQLADSRAIVIVDVRDEGSFQNGHIPGARSIPLDDVEKRIPELKKELKKLKKPIVTYCA